MMKHSFEQLIEDLKPAMREWLIGVIKSDAMIIIRLNKYAPRRVQLTEHINQHYDVKAHLHGASSIQVHRKETTAL